MNNKLLQIYENNLVYKIICLLGMLLYIGMMVYIIYINYIVKLKLFPTAHLPALLLIILFLIVYTYIIRNILSNNIETFHIYNDKIESRTVNGIKNIIYFKELKQVKEVKLLTGKIIYIFDDGRKDGLFNKVLFTSLNNVKYNLRIDKTEELEQLIHNHIMNIT